MKKFCIHPTRQLAHTLADASCIWWVFFCIRQSGWSSRRVRSYPQLCSPPPPHNNSSEPSQLPTAEISTPPPGLSCFF